MTKDQVAQMVAIRYQFGHYFCQLLQKLLVKVPDGPIRLALQANLAEEQGASDLYPGPAHCEGRKRLLQYLGINYDSWKPQGAIGQLGDNPHPAAIAVVTEFNRLVDNSNFLVGAAAIAASESLVPEHYEYLVKLLKQYWPQLPDHAMYHLIDHIEHDVHHGSNLEELLAQEQDQNAVAYGKAQAGKAWKQFWQDI